MGDPSRSYFEQAAMWSGDHPAAVTILEAVQALIPDGTTSVLDVGCGDGALTNRLRDVGTVVGGDISLAALQYVVGPRLNFSADALPFADDSFDIVIATDVIEHLPDGLLERAMAEMVRVARIGLVIAVPFREPREYFGIECSSCGHRYHAHGHVRGYDVASFTGLPSLALATWRLAGPRWTYSESLAGQMRDITRTSYEFPHAICPNCGTEHEVVAPPPGAATAVRRFDALQYLRCEHGLDAWPPPSELVVLVTIGPDGATDADDADDADDAAPQRPLQPWTLRLEPDRRRDDPENFATDWYWIHDPTGTVIVVVPVRPVAVRVVAGDVAEIAVFDAVDARYRPIDGDAGRADELALVRPGAAGYVLRLVGPSDDLQLEIESGSAGAEPDALVALAFGTEIADRQAAASEQRIAELTAALNELAVRHQALVLRYEETWGQLQEMAEAKAALNDLAEELEAKRAELESRLSGPS